MAKEVTLVVTVKDDAGKPIKNIKDGVDDLKKSVDSVGDSVKKSDGFIGQFSRSLSEIGGKLKADIKLGADAFRGITGALKGSTLAAKGFAVALAATGITLVTAAVAALISYFKNFEGAAKLVDKALAGVAAVGTQLVKIFQAIMKGDFSEAGKQFKNIGKEASDAANNVDKLYKATNDYEEAANKGAVQSAALRQNIEKNKKVLEDETLSYEKRKKALEDVNRDTKNLGDLELALATKLKEKLKTELALEKNFERQRELRSELAQATAEEINKQTELNNIKDDAAKKEREIENKRTEDAKKNAEDRIKLEADAQKQIQALKDENYLNSIKDDRKRAEETIRIAKERAIEAIKALKLNKNTEKELIAQEEKKAQLALKAIDDDFAQKKLDEEKEDAEKLADLKKRIAEGSVNTEQEIRQKEIQDVKDFYATLIAEAKAAKLDTSELTKTQNEKVAELNKKFREEDAELNKKFREEEIQKELAASQAKAAIVMSYADSLATLGGIFQQLAGESKGLAIAGITIEKGAAIAKVITSTQIANAGALATPQAIATSGVSAIPVITANKVAGAVSIAAIIAGAAQGISQIMSAESTTGSSNEKGTPTPATKFAKGGLLRGPSHAQGGILTRFGELEGGEFITNKFATQAFLPMLEQINRMGQSGPEPMGATSPMSNQIIKTYVVASEMDTALEKRKKLQDLARL